MVLGLTRIAQPDEASVALVKSLEATRVDVRGAYVCLGGKTKHERHMSPLNSKVEVLVDRDIVNREPPRSQQTRPAPFHAGVAPKTQMKWPLTVQRELETLEG